MQYTRSKAVCFQERGPKKRMGRGLEQIQDYNTPNSAKKHYNLLKGNWETYL